MTFPAPRRAAAVLALAAAPVAILATAGTNATAAAGKTVVLKDIAFKPANVTISRGTTVTWRFDDNGTKHNVRSVGARRFKGSADKATGTHRVTFRRAGLYRYVCTLHLGMKGSVRVR